MANQVSSVDVPLSIFGSLNLELSPPDLPEGASPANNDVVYLPGSVSTRPGLNRVFSVAVSSLGPFSYEKSFVTPSGGTKNLYLTQGDGKLWVEDVSNTPGTATLLFQSAGATYASSCTASGREYIALSDGVHGADIPLQYDGTNLRRLTQDGPGVAPVVTSIAYPPATIANVASASTTVVSATTTDLVGGFYYTLTVTVNSTAAFSVGQYVSISGNTNSALNAAYTVGTILSPTMMVLPYSNYGAPFETGTGGTLATLNAVAMVRSNNTVTATTAAAHNLLKGYQAQISGVPTYTAIMIASSNGIVVNNENNPGIATITTTAAHGLLPNNQITIGGVTGATVGTAITNIAYAGGYVTVTTSAAHGLSIGSEILMAAVTATWVNGQWIVAQIPSAYTFTFAFISYGTFSNATYSYAASDSGTVKYIWPLASVNPATNYFTVQTCPTATTFTVAISYTDGVWNNGTISFAWDGTFFVTAILSSTAFQYQQYGPNASYTVGGSDVPLVTPYGQATPGIHQVQMSFLLDSGSITAPSPSSTFVANGGQYLSVTQMAIGPSNVVARILQFTGAGGAYFYYIPVPAFANGIQVSTATQVNDNTSTAVILDFSDNTLYADIATSKPGNNLAAQITMDPSAGMFTYASRLTTWGVRNKIQNLLNPGFDGGYVSASSNIPAGWTATLGSGSCSLVAGRVPGFAVQLTTWVNGSGLGPVLSQSGYLTASGGPVLLPNTQYTVRLLLQPDVVGTNGVSFIAKFSSASTGYSSTATIANGSMSAAGSWIQANFSLVTPSAIPSDMLISIEALQVAAIRTLTIDEFELIFTTTPYLDAQAWMSYATNLTAFDANTGDFGSDDDTSPIMNFGTIRDTLYFVTGSGLHETEDNKDTEPSQWDVRNVADNCGAFSIASVGRNAQGIGSAGKDWMMWSGPDGAQIFTGQKPYKVSQEIQSIWDAIPAANQYQCWTKNYESSKRCYFGVPSGGSMEVLVLDYRNIDGAAIAENPPVHISFTGKMIVSDLTRKWTTWTIPAYCGELLYRGAAAQPQIVFGCSNPSGAANAYILNPAQYFDDDFGTIPASYTTYFFVSHEQEQALQVGSHRHIYTMAAAFISGVGTWTLTPLAASVNNPFPSSPAFPLSLDPFFDMDFGINVETTRCAFRIQASPVSGNSAYFKLQKLVINMAPSAWTKVRGSSSGAF